MTDPNTDKTTEYGVPYSDNEYHDEWEVDFHAMEPCDVDDDACKKRHQDQTLEVYCDTHPSAPECKVYDD